MKVCSFFLGKLIMFLLLREEKLVPKLRVHFCPTKYTLNTKISQTPERKTQIFAPSFSNY